ncbi:MAG TPA: response regulator [Thermotogota bacterium]|nr:response regulator [Thermotogota bacterium]
MNTQKNIVMLVDDSPANLKILSNLLEDKYRLIVAKGGQKALDIINSGNIPDLILLDILMPDIDGYTVCRQLKGSEKTRDIPIIFISAMNQSDDEEKGLTIGAVDYITKPFVPSLVLSRVDTHLKLSNSMREAKTMYSQSLELNKDLGIKNAQISMILNHSGEGFLVLEKDFKIHSEHSRECDKIFGTNVHGKDFKTLFSDFEGIRADEDIEILSELFDLPCEILRKKSAIYLSLLPETIIKSGKYYNVRYSLIQADDLQGRKILIMLKDITEEKKLREKLVQEHQLLLTIISIISNMEEYKLLIINSFMFFGNVFLRKLKTAEQREINFLYRATHTFKGEFGKLNIMEVVKKLDGLECMISDIVENDKPLDYPVFKEKYDTLDLLTTLEETNLLVEKYSGRNVLLEDDMNDFLTVNKRIIHNFETFLEKAPDRIEKAVIIDNLKKLEYKSLYSVLDSYCSYSKTLAADLGKEALRTSVTGDDVFLEPIRYGNMLKSLIHLFRNMVDHGIETADERYNAGKNIHGSITCSISRKDDWVALIIADDGKGVDLERLKENIRKTLGFSDEKIEAMNKKELFQYLFEMNISTKLSKTLISGRGIGLSAVKSELTKINGSVEIESEARKGTTYLIRFKI